MKLPSWLAPLVVGVLFSLQAWTLLEIIDLKVAVAEITGSLHPEKTTELSYHEK